MADVTMEPMFEVLKSVQARLAQVDGKVDELKQEMHARERRKTASAKRSPASSRSFRAYTRRWCDTRAVWILSSAASN